MKGLHKNSIQDVGNPHQWMIDDARMELIQQIKAEVERLKKEIYPVKVGEQRVNRGPTSMESAALGALNTLMSRISDLEKEEKPTIQEQPVKTNIVEDLKHYLATTPKEQIKKDWESLKEWDKVGPSVSEFLGWEQPVCEGLERAVVDYFEGYWPGMETAEQCNTDLHFTPPAIMRLAHHFAKWGAKHRGSSETSKDQDIAEASEKYAGELYGYELKSDEDLQKVIACICGFKAGAKWQKEQMMNDSAEGVVCGDNAKLWVCNNPPSFILDKFKDGDKVKLIFIKEN